MLASAEVLRHLNGKTLGEPLNDAQHQPDDPLSRPNRAKGIHSQRTADDHGVRYRVKLLKQVADHQREGKGEDQRAWPASSHAAYIKIVSIYSCVFAQHYLLPNHQEVDVKLYIF